MIMTLACEGKIVSTLFLLSAKIFMKAKPF